MNRVWTILMREYKDRVKKRSFLIGTILGPVFLLGVTVVPMWLASRSSGKPMEILVVDHSGAMRGKLEQAFPDTLPTGMPRYNFDWSSPTAQSAEEFLEAGVRDQLLAEEYSGLLWVPGDVMTEGEAELYAQGLGDPEVLGRFRSALSRAAMMHRLEERGIAPEETDEISRRVPMKTFKITEKGVREGGFEADFLTGFVFAMMLYMTILLYGISVQRSVLEDKNSRIVEILLSTVKPLQLMLGKIVGVGGVGLTQYAIWAIVAIAGMSYLKGTNPALANMTALSPLTLTFFIVYFALGYLLFAAIYAAIGAMVNSDQEAQQMQWPVTSLLIIPIVLMTMILKDPDSTASVVLSLVPFFSPILMMLRINTATPPMWQLLLSVVLLLGAILAFAAIAARIFRIGILMYGKRPTLPEIVRWIKAS